MTHYPTLKAATFSLFSLCLLLSLLLPSIAFGQQQGEWTAVTGQGATPEARHESAFVKFGDRFFLIGGRGRRTVQVYDPATKTWTNTKTFTDNIHHFQARAYGDKIYLLGALTQGYPNEDPLNNVLIYDPGQDKLVTGAAIPASRRRGSSGIVVYNGVFYIVAGNRNGHSAFLDDGKTPANVAWTDKFDPATGTWTVLPDAPRARDHFFAEVIGNKIYVAGGRRSKVGTSDGAFKDTETVVDVFDLTTEKWLTGSQLPASIPTARAGAATGVINNELLVIGGEVENNPPNNLALSSTEILNTATGQWRRGGDLVRGRHAGQAVVCNDEVYIAAGSKTRGGTEITANETFLEKFSFGAATGTNYDKWTDIGNSPAPKSEAQMVTYRGEYYIFNGFSPGIKIANTVEKYNPATNVWTQLKPMPTENGKVTAVTHNGIALVDGIVWSVGGRVGDNPGPVTDRVWLYDIAKNSWSEGPKLPLRRGGGGLGRLGRQLHYVGGFDEFAACDVDIHLMYDLDKPSLGWQDLTASSPMPMPRVHFGTIVYGGKLYTIGGQFGHDGCAGGKNNALLHVYDPATDSWKRLADLPGVQSHIEPGCFVHNNKIVVVGGQTNGKTVWEYDPKTDKWVVRNDLQLPLGLLAPAARVYRGNLTVMNGGAPGTAEPVSTTRTITYTPLVGAALAFNPGSLSLALDGKSTRRVEVILSNLHGDEDAPYQIDTESLPAWLTVDRGTGVVRESFVEVGLTFDARGLTNGNYSHALAVTSPGYTPSTLQVTMKVTGADSPAPTVDKFSAYLEAECGTIGTNWKAGSGKGSSGDGYVEPLPGKNSTGAPPADVPANQLSYAIDLPKGDNYRLHARIDAPSGSDDSFWVRVNGGLWIKWWQGLQTSGGFAWREVTGSPFTLPAGRVKIDFAYREDGALLDKLFLTNQSKQPTGATDLAINCSTTPPPPTTPSFTAIRINAGGPAVIQAGQTFAGDTDFSGGKVYANPSATVPELYQSERSSEAPYQYSYRVAVPNGNYKVRLHFAEIYFGANGGGAGGNGKRVFDVRLENKMVLDNYDINADVGPQKVTVKEFPVTITDGYVDLFLDASTGVGGINQPKLSALEILEADATVPPTSVADLWAEAECGDGGSEWQTKTSSAASSGQYVSFAGSGNLPAPNQANTARELSYSVTLTETGEYRVFFLMNTPSTGENSFWVSIDGGSWIKFWREKDGSQLLTQGFEWREVNDDARQVSLPLLAGKHTIRVAPREQGTQLDKVYLGKATSAPSGQGEDATNCGGQQQRSLATTAPAPALLIDEKESEPLLTLYPNPVRSELNFKLSNVTGEMAEVRISDTNGRLLQTTRHQTFNQLTLRSSLDVSDLPAGSYHVQIIGAGGDYLINRSFIKAR